jgi:hypothetical protein
VPLLILILPGVGEIEHNMGGVAHTPPAGCRGSGRRRRRHGASRGSQAVQRRRVHPIQQAQADGGAGGGGLQPREARRAAGVRASSCCLLSWTLETREAVVRAIRASVKARSPSPSSSTLSPAAKSKGGGAPVTGPPPPPPVAGAGAGAKATGRRSAASRPAPTCANRSWPKAQAARREQPCGEQKKRHSGAALGRAGGPPASCAGSTSLASSSCSRERQA